MHKQSKNWSGVQYPLNAKWPIKSWSTNYKKKSSFNFVKYVKKKIFYQKLTFFTQISKCSTDTILHHPDSELAGQIHLETTKIFHAVLISIYLGNSAGWACGMPIDACICVSIRPQLENASSRICLDGFSWCLDAMIVRWETTGVFRNLGSKVI